MPIPESSLPLVRPAALRLSLLLLPLFAAAPGVRAQTYNLSTLATFDYNTTGVNPQSLVFNGGSTLYGVTGAGGSSGNGNGTLFSYSLSSHALTTLASFGGANNSTVGSSPTGITLDAQGNVFGVMSNGGSSNFGTVWKYTAATGTASGLASFTGQNGNGQNPGGVTIGSDGNLYGTLAYGGPGGNGFLYQYNSTTGALTDVASFGNTSLAGPFAQKLVQGADGNLYGSAFYGGTAGKGGLFKYNPVTQAFTVIASFSGTNGANPLGSLSFDGSGNLYGATAYGGTGYTGSSNTGNGTVFKYNLTSGVLTNLVKFNGTNGQLPEGIIVDAAGNVTGVNAYGGSDYDSSNTSLNGSGTVFRYSSAGVLATIANFAGTGTSSPSSIAADSGGNFYVATNNGANRLSQLTPTGSAAPEPTALALLLPAALPLLMAGPKRRYALRKTYGSVA